MKKIFIFTIVIALLLSTVIFATPGDTTDPIVVLSYLNKRIDKLIEEYDLGSIKDMKTQIENLKSADSKDDDNSTDSSDSSDNSDVNANQSLQIIEINKEEKIIAKNGTELILRGGKAYIIGSEMGGLSDVTSGKDLASGYEVPANHLLIVPRDDGRGVYTKDHAIFMVRGEFEIVKE